MQPFVVTLCGLLIYRGIARFYTEDATAGFAFGESFPTLEWLTTGRTYGVPHSLDRLHRRRRRHGRRAAPLGLRPLSLRGRQERGGGALFRHQHASASSIAAYVICCGLTALAAVFIAMYTRSISPSSHGNFYELYAIAAAVLGGCSLRGGEGSIIGVVLGTVLLQVLQNLVNLLGIPSSLNFAVMGSRHPDRRARRPADLAALFATEDARRLTASGLANAVPHPVGRLVHRDEFFRRRRMHGHGAVEIVLGDARPSARCPEAAPSRRRRGQVHGRPALSAWRHRPPASSASFPPGPTECAASGGTWRGRPRYRQKRLAASSSDRPTVPISGCENTAVGMHRDRAWSDCP